MSAYRPPGRSNRSGRSNGDNDVFEGLPVKQWGQQQFRVSLAPPASETRRGQDNRWGEPPMPRDYHLLLPWTQHILRLARSGKVGTKRKQGSDSPDDDKPEDDIIEEISNNACLDDRAFVAKRWKPLPEHMLIAEHKHFEYLAKRKKGLPSLYAPDQPNGVPVPMRKTKVQKADANGESVVYEVLVPEGHTVEGEVADSTELSHVKTAVAAPGTVIEGVGIANEDGVVVAEHLKPSMTFRRNRPPPKKKGGPGRGKKRVTFTNPDGTTYTTVVPNATKIVPQPGQIVKHVAKGEEATADITAAEIAAKNQNSVPAEDGGDDGEESDGDEDDDEDDDDDREEGEVSDEDAPGTGAVTPAKPATPVTYVATGPTAEAEASEVDHRSEQPMEDVQPTNPSPEAHNMPEITEPVWPIGLEETIRFTDSPDFTQPTESTEFIEAALAGLEGPEPRDPSSSPEMPLANNHSRTGSLADLLPVVLDDTIAMPTTRETSLEMFDDGDEDLLANLERHLGEDIP